MVCICKERCNCAKKDIIKILEQHIQAYFIGITWGGFALLFFICGNFKKEIYELSIIITFASVTQLIIMLLYICIIRQFVSDNKEFNIFIISKRLDKHKNVLMHKQALIYHIDEFLDD